MSRISVLGGTGYAGSAVVDVAVARGHQVTSFSRHEPANKRDGVEYVIGSVLEPEVLEASVTGHDVVIEAVSPRGDMAGEEEGLVDRLIDLTSGTGTRLGVIGGASSLLVEEGGPRLYDVSQTPPEVRPEVETGMAVLEALKGAAQDVDWFYVSPPASFGAWVPAPTRAATGSAKTSCSRTMPATRPSPLPISPAPSSTRSSNRSSTAAASTPRTDPPSTDRGP